MNYNSNLQRAKNQCKGMAMLGREREMAMQKLKLRGAHMHMGKMPQDSSLTIKMGLNSNSNGLQHGLHSRSPHHFTSSYNSRSLIANGKSKITR